MQYKNTPTRYGLISKLFHWIMAGLVIFMLALGLYMENAPMDSKFQLYGLHKSLGILILFLVTLRVFWHIYSTKPPLVDGMKSWEKIAAKLGHYFLYLGMFGMPMSGWVLSSAAGRSVKFFDLFTLPDLVSKNDAIRELCGGIHFFLAYALIAGIAVHALAALKHHFWNKDDTLRRMISGFVLVIALSITPTNNAQANVAKWDVVPSETTLGFNASQMGQGFQGLFHKFDADIAFDPEQLDQSQIIIDVDVTSIDSGDASRNETSLGTDWFDSQTFPTARFVSESFKHLGKDMYETHGNLTIKDITLPLTFAFRLQTETLENDQEKARVTANINIDRSEFKLGQGEWADSSIIENNVMVNVNLVALKTSD